MKDDDPESLFHFIEQNEDLIYFWLLDAAKALLKADEEAEYKKPESLPDLRKPKVDWEM